MGILETPLWDRLLEAYDDKKQRQPVLREAKSEVTREDFGPLLKACEEGGPNELWAATRLIDELIASGRLNEEEQHSYLFALKTIRKKEELLSPVWSQVQTVIGALEKDYTASISEALDEKGVTREEYEAMARTTLERKNRELKPRVQELGVPEALSSILDSLEEPERFGTDLRTIVEDWRRTRSPESLGSIYYNLIIDLPVGVITIQQLVNLLGEPDNWTGRDVWYSPTSGCSLFLEGDSRGFLSGRHFS